MNLNNHRYLKNLQTNQLTQVTLSAIKLANQKLPDVRSCGFLFF